MTERHALVEYKALAAPAALCLGHVFQVFQDAALEVIDVGEAAREQVRAGLFAANAAGAEHRDLAMRLRIEMACGKILELAEARDLRIERAFERAHRDFKCVP